MYSAANGGYYDDRLECLGAPARCIPGYPPAAPTFIDAELTQAVRMGYRRVLHAGVPADPKDLATGRISPSSSRTFAYVATPVDETGIDSFCGDSDGRICVYRAGRAPQVEDGLCARRCDTLN